MLKPVFFIALVCFSFSCFAQETGEDEYLISGPYHVFYTNSNRPFFEQPFEADSIQFCLYNQWGEMIAKTSLKSFVIDAVLLPGTVLKKDTYIWKTIVYKEGIKDERHGHSCYMGVYEIPATKE